MYKIELRLYEFLLQFTDDKPRQTDVVFGAFKFTGFNSYLYMLFLLSYLLAKNTFFCCIDQETFYRR